MAIRLGRSAISGVNRLRKRRAGKRKNTPRSSLPMSVRSVPAARTYHVESRAARVTTGLRSTTISNHELIATVAGSEAFTATRYAVNPGLLIYTWLSTQAAGWEKYRFKRLSFVYVPAQAVVTTPGSVYLAADYDPTTGPPTSLQGLSTYETQSNARVFESCSLNVPPKRMFDGIQHKRIRCGNVAGDLEAYDGCSFIFSTVSCNANVSIGQLWVHYEVEFFSPQTAPQALIPQNYTFCKQEQQAVGTLEPNDGSFANINWNLSPTLTALGLVRLPTTASPEGDIYRLPCGSYRLDGAIALSCANAVGGASYAFALYFNGQPVAGSGFVISSTVDPDGITHIPFNTYVQIVNPGDYFQLKLQINDPTPVGAYGFDQGGSLAIQTL